MVNFIVVSIALKVSIDTGASRKQKPQGKCLPVAFVSVPLGIKIEEEAKCGEKQEKAEGALKMVMSSIINGE